MRWLLGLILVRINIANPFLFIVEDWMEASNKRRGEIERDEGGNPCLLLGSSLELHFQELRHFLQTQSSKRPENCWVSRNRALESIDTLLMVLDKWKIARNNPKTENLFMDNSLSETLS